MLTISQAIKNIKAKLALVPFVTAGYPSMDITEKVIYLLDKKGANVIELGIPYSDALADGLVIQESSRIALEKNIFIDQVLGLLNKVIPKINTPIVIFSYFNPILCRGLDIFIKEIASVGVKGLVIPDLPLEESEYLTAICNYYNIELIFFVSPATSEKRMQQIISKAPGCLYLVSSYGVTGEKDKLAYNIKSIVKAIKLKTNKCVMLGFGISNDRQVSHLMSIDLGIDAIVMGTAFINQISQVYEDNSYDKLEIFCQNIKEATF